MTTDFEDLPDIVERIDRTWKSLNTEEIRLLLLEARSEIRRLRALVKFSTKKVAEANKELDRMFQLYEREMKR